MMCAPVYDLRALMGARFWVANHTINALPLHPFPALEDMRFKGQGATCDLDS